MTAHVKQGGVAKQLSEIYVKQGGVVKSVQEGWVKEGGVVKQFFTLVTPNPFGIYQGGSRLVGILVYNYAFPIYGTAVSIDGEDDGTGPYTYQWSVTNTVGTMSFIGATNERTVSLEVAPEYSGTLECEVVGTGPGGATRTVSIPITISANNPP